MYLTVALSVLGIVMQNVAAVTVTINQGILNGEQLWTITGNTMYNSFKGIPYAKPPIGDLRFELPQPPEPWEGIRNATAHGDICPQYSWATSAFVPGNEDCLFVNVYVPSSREGLLPVMFFIHGGGFGYGSGNDNNYGPDFLIDQNVVLITHNFRLDSLGFLCLDSPEMPGNLGLKDQVAAMKWVQSNIENFGGDPNQVTLFAEDGAAGNFHVVSPMSKGLFKRVILMNGVAKEEYNVPFQQKRRAVLLSKLLGFESENTTEIYNFLKTAPVKDLINPNTSVIAAEAYIDFVAKVYPVAVVEKDFGQERFLTESVDDSVLKKRLNTEEFLIGFASNIAMTCIGLFESPTYYMMPNYDRYPETFVTRSLFYDVTPRNVLKLADQIKEHYFGSHPFNLDEMPQIITYFSHIYTFPLIRFINHLASVIQDIYFYEFSFISERNHFNAIGAKYNITGVAHTDDLNYLFNAKRYNFPLDKSAPSYAKIVQTCTLFTRFAKYGNPTTNSSLGIDWPVYDLRNQTYLNIGDNLTLYTKPRVEMMQFWQSLFEQAGVKF